MAPTAALIEVTDVDRVAQRSEPRYLLTEAGYGYRFRPGGP